MIVETFALVIFLLTILSPTGFSGSDSGFVCTLVTLTLTWSVQALKRCWSRCLTFTHSPQALHFVSYSTTKCKSSDDGGMADSGTRE